MNNNSVLFSIKNLDFLNQFDEIMFKDDDDDCVYYVLSQYRGTKIIPSQSSFTYICQQPINTIIHKNIYHNDNLYYYYNSRRKKVILHDKFIRHTKAGYVRCIKKRLIHIVEHNGMLIALTKKQINKYFIIDNDVLTIKDKNLATNIKFSYKKQKHLTLKQFIQRLVTNLKYFDNADINISISANVLTSDDKFNT